MAPTSIMIAAVSEQAVRLDRRVVATIHARCTGNMMAMYITQIYSLTNLSANQFLELRVEEGQQVIVAAQAYLRESDLSLETQQGFFVSVYPTGRSVDHRSGDVDERQNCSAAPAGIDDSSESADTGLSASASPALDTADTLSVADPGPVEAPEGDSSPVGDRSGSLAAAAEAGPMPWTDEQAPAEPDQPLIIGIPFGSSGGH